MDAADLARAAQHVAQLRLLTYAEAPQADVRRGPGWYAVRTGVHSNEFNGVVSAPRAAIDAALVSDLTHWLADAPASWWTPHPDPALTALLVATGARPERTGSWSGCPLPRRTASPSRRAEISRVASDAALSAWLDAATTCGWLASDADRDRRHSLYAALGPNHAALQHWVAWVDDRPVGFASSYLDGVVVDLCNLGVEAAHRRLGIGRALVTARLAEAARRGATTVVSAPSPDGWQLQRALGFVAVPVVPDTCFYLG